MISWATDVRLKTKQQAQLNESSQKSEVELYRMCRSRKWSLPTACLRAKANSPDASEQWFVTTLKALLQKPLAATFSTTHPIARTSIIRASTCFLSCRCRAWYECGVNKKALFLNSVLWIARLFHLKVANRIYDKLSYGREAQDETTSTIKRIITKKWGWTL